MPTDLLIDLIASVIGVANDDIAMGMLPRGKDEAEFIAEKIIKAMCDANRGKTLPSEIPVVKEFEEYKKANCCVDYLQECLDSGAVVRPTKPVVSKLDIVNRALLKAGGHEGREPLYEDPSTEQPVDCRSAFEAWHNEDHGFIPSYGETCYDSEDSDALYDAFKAAWKPEWEIGNDAQNAARYLYLKGHCSTRYSMTQEQPMECVVHYEFQQSKPYQVGWNLDRCIDADIERQITLDAENTDIEGEDDVCDEGWTESAFVESWHFKDKQKEWEDSLN